MLVAQEIYDKAVNEPAFEIMMPNGHRYKIYADGRAEGFGDDFVVLNYIPPLMRLYAAVKTEEGL